MKTECIREIINDEKYLLLINGKKNSIFMINFTKYLKNKKDTSNYEMLSFIYEKETAINKFSMFINTH
jgi:thioredoxin-related protein